MADLNIISVSNIKGRTFASNVDSTTMDIIDNTAGNSKIFKVNNILLSNKTSSNTIAGTVNFVDYSNGNTSFPIVFEVDVPGKSTIEVLSKSIYLEEGDKITSVSGEANNLVIIVSYEEMA